MSVQKVLLCPLLGQLRQSAVNLESSGLKNIPQVQGNLAEVGQNHDARYAHRDFDELLLDFLELGEYFPVPGTLN